MENTMDFSQTKPKVRSLLFEGNATLLKKNINLKMLQSCIYSYISEYYKNKNDTFHTFSKKHSFKIAYFP